MTEETRFSAEHVSVVMTTTPDDDDVTMVTGNSAAATSTSRGVEFYFQCAVVVIGVIGIVANGLILYALVVSREHRKKALIFNQNALDFFSCLWLVITYAVKLGNLHLTGSWGHWVCAVVLSEGALWAGLTGSKIGLAAVTVERYLKVVHRALSKKWLRSRVIYAAAAFVWLVGLVDLAIIIPTNEVVNGACYVMVLWGSRTIQLAYVLWYFLSFKAILLVIMIYCYGHILVVIRRQARVMASHNQASASHTAQNQTDRKIQSNVIKTMIIVSAFFALSNLPVGLRFVIVNFTDQATYDDFGYYSTLFIMFLFVCMNPFIYATKFNPVKRVLLGLIPRKRNPVHHSQSATT